MLKRIVATALAIDFFPSVGLLRELFTPTLPWGAPADGSPFLECDNSRAAPLPS